MNKITILAIGAVFAVSMIAITAFEVEAAPPSKVACPAENVQHWNKITFQLRQDIHHPTLPNLIPDHFYEVIVQADPNAIHDIEVLVESKLTELGYTQDNGNPLSGVGMQERDVEYSTICAEN